MSVSASLILITGLPGVGKTTIIKKLINDLKNVCINENHIQGFYTEEIRDNYGKLRIGFDAITLSGHRDKLARATTNLNVNEKNKKPTLGKYSIYVVEFENIVIPLFTIPLTKILILDEIGKMEFFSYKFKLKIKELITELNNNNNNKCLIATIPIDAGRLTNICENLKSVKSSKLFIITKENRNDIYLEIFDMAKKMI